MPMKDALLSPNTQPRGADTRVGDSPTKPPLSWDPGGKPPHSIPSTIRHSLHQTPAKPARLFGIEMTVRLPPKWVFGISRNACSICPKYTVCSHGEGLAQNEQASKRVGTAGSPDEGAQRLLPVLRTPSLCPKAERRVVASPSTLAAGIGTPEPASQTTLRLPEPGR